MKQKNYALTTPMVILIFLSLYSCGSIKNKTTNEQRSNEIFSNEEAIQNEDFYKNISGSVARLQAMLCGKFLHLSCNKEEDDDCDNWRTSSGEDSVMLCRIPAGDYRKDGYWIYQYQYLSSLPAEPIQQVFYKLTPISRDTIRVVYYSVPSDFKFDLTQQNVKLTKSIFDELDLKRLKKGQVKGDSLFVNYVRQDFTRFKGESNMKKAHSTYYKDVEYDKYTYDVKFDETFMKIKLYNEEQEKIVQVAIKFLKIAAINPRMYEP